MSNECILRTEIKSKEFFTATEKLLVLGLIIEKVFHKVVPLFKSQ